MKQKLKLRLGSSFWASPGLSLLQGSAHCRLWAARSRRWRCSSGQEGVIPFVQKGRVANAAQQDYGWDLLKPPS